MSCTHLMRAARTAGPLHRAFCRDCRRGFRADTAISFAIACRREEPISSTALERTLSALDLPNAMPHRQGYRLKGHGRIVGKVLTFGFAGLSLAAFGWTRYIELEPEYPISEPQISGQNAYPWIQHAAQQMVEKNTIDQMLLRNSAKLQVYRTAASAVEGSGVETDGADSSNDFKEFTIEEKEGLLRLNAPAISAVRIGLGKDYLAPPMRSMSAPTTHYSDSRALARLLRVDSETAAMRERWSDAATSAMDAIALGGKIQQNGGVMASLTGAACEAIGRDALWPVVNRLNTEEAKAVAARLNRIMAFRPFFRDCLIEERNITVAGLKETMSQPGWRWKALSIINSETPEAASSWSSYFMLAPFPKSTILKNTLSDLDAAIAEASTNWTPYDADHSSERKFKDPLTAVMTPVYDNARFRSLSSVTQSTLLMHALELQAHFAKYRSYPVTYDSATSSKLYLDPFLPGQTLIYRGHRDKYVLYSVGPDCLDNGGTPILHAERINTRAQRYISIDSKGDIVAGVNRW